VYAIVRSGGKQYRVKPGETIYVESLAGAKGDKVTLAEVLLVAGEGEPRLGSQLIDKAAVLGTVVEQGREHYRRTRGHRQSYTAVRIDSIEL
jgi:large subunit ribosomal protein L21